MGESSSYEPAAWGSCTSFTQARSAYDQQAGRSYSAAQQKGLKAKDVVPAKIKTKSTHPLVIATDLTGSMQDRPGIMFGKMPYMWSEIANSYLGADAEVSFIGVTDFGDSYPLQVQPFGQAEDLRKALEKFIHGGGSGGSYDMHQHERYDAAALYAARNIEIPNAVRPTLIFIGDEEPYPETDPTVAAEMAQVNLEKALKVEAVFQELMRKFEVYFILCPYGRTANDKNEAIDADTRRIQATWHKLLGPERVVMLTDAERVVDVIFGLLGQVTGKQEYFEKELNDRQKKPGQVKTVMKSLATVYGKDKDQKLLKSGKSRLKGADDEKDGDAEPLL